VRRTQKECLKCKRVGHAARRCKGGKTNKNQNSVHSLEGKHNGGDCGDDEVSEEELKDMIDKRSDIHETHSIYSCDSYKSIPIIIQPLVNGIKIPMELDTGASLSVVNKETFKRLSKGSRKLRLQNTDVIFKTYSGQLIKAIGKAKIVVKYSGQSQVLNVYVVDGDKPNLFGREWLNKIRLNWNEIFHVDQSEGELRLEEVSELNNLFSEFAELFGADLGLMKGEKAKIYIKDNAIPKFCKARPIPYSLRPKVEIEINRMVELGILQPVEVSEWATPIVPVKKPDGTVRVCGDYKITVNKISMLDNFPIPTIEDVCVEMAGCSIFAKLDLWHAYQQMELDDESRDVLTLNTHKGLYRPTRLATGIKSATGIFQRAIEKCLCRCPNTVVRVDDILIGGKTKIHILQNLKQVFTILKMKGLRLKKEKCVFLKEAVDYLGMRFDKNGVTPVEEKIQAILEKPSPTNISQLRAFLGMLNYYRKHLGNVATCLEPLHMLLRSGVKWRWGSEQIKAFENAKKLLTSAKLLVHYDPGKKLLLACDASPYGLGAVLSHVDGDGTEKPIAFASRTLNSAERNYSQLQKEGLAIIFGVKKFHQFCYGRHFTIVTDHKPLEGLLGEESRISGSSAPWIQRWAVFCRGTTIR